MPDKPTTLFVRLHAGIARGGSDECWPWTKGTNGHGYGSLTNYPSGGRTYAHRLAWEEINGPIPSGMLVCHRCDNPPCCNPAHLFLGTVKDNAADMMTKGRSHMVGPTNPNQRLSDETVQRVRDLFTQGMRQADICRMLGISRPHVSNIVHGRRRI